MVRIRLFPLLIQNGCSQSSRLPTAGQGEGDCIYTGDHISLSWFSCAFSILVELEFGDVEFVQGGKPENPEKNLNLRPRREQWTQLIKVTVLQT